MLGLKVEIILPWLSHAVFFMPIEADTIKSVSALLYERALKKIPDDTRSVLAQAQHRETDPTARHTIMMMVESADLAHQQGSLVFAMSAFPPTASRSARVSNFLARYARPSQTGLRSWWPTSSLPF